MKTAARIQPKVLVGEDDPHLRRLVAHALRDDGYEVRALSDGGDVLLELGSDGRGYSLVVCDVRMPACSGLQVLGAIRRARIDVPVILMSAFADRGLRERIEGQGAFFFDKPFDMDDLRTAAAHALRDAPVRWRHRANGLELLTKSESALDAWSLKWMLEASDICAVLTPDGPRTNVYVLGCDAARARAVVESIDCD